MKTLKNIFLLTLYGSLFWVLVSCQKETIDVKDDFGATKEKSADLTFGFTTKKKTLKAKELDTKGSLIPRYNHASLVFDDKMWIAGGAGEMDPSTNGVDWVQETDAAPYSSRFGFEAIVFDDKIFMISGALSTTFEAQADVWYSTDGKNWTQTQQSEGSGSYFLERVYFNSTVFNGKIWITGGFLQNALEPTIQYTDFWSSSDGIRWKRETPDAGYEARSSATLVSNHEYMLLIGGRDATTTDRLNDVWKFD